MIKWLIDESDFEYCSYHDIHPFFKFMTELHRQGLDQPDWIGVSHEAFNAHLIKSNINAEKVSRFNLESLKSEYAKSRVPSELIQAMKAHWEKSHFVSSRFMLEILISSREASEATFPWDPWSAVECESIDGVDNLIWKLWGGLFNEMFLSYLEKRNINFESLRVTILMRPHFNSKIQGQLLSYSPRSLWDPQTFVIAYQTPQREAAYLVERGQFRATYYGKSPEVSLEKPRRVGLGDGSVDRGCDLSEDQLRLLGEFLKSCEQKLNRALDIKWAFDEFGRILILRIIEYRLAPQRNYFDVSKNPKTKNVWDQNLIKWDPSKLLEPLWFSLLPRLLRLIAIRAAGTMGAKAFINAEYEKVFRGLIGILRGRPYVNLGALHRFLVLSGNEDLASEIEFIVPLWLHRYDREMVSAWDSVWPISKKLNHSVLKMFSKKNKEQRNQFPKRMKSCTDQLHYLREALSSQKLKAMNVSEILAFIQEVERKYTPFLVPIFLAELQYWNLRSWYYQNLNSNSERPSWNEHFKPEPLRAQVGWFHRRRIEKLYLQMEELKDLREKYLVTLNDIWGRVQRLFDLLGEKYKDLNLVEKSSDIRYLTFDELLGFEEGRSACTQWQPILALRKSEYEIYNRDEYVPELWVTSGIIGLAARYPKVIAVREGYNRRMARDLDAAIVSDKGANIDLQDDFESRPQRSAKFHLFRSKKEVESESFEN